NKALVIDDNKKNIAVMEALLEDEGFQVYSLINPNQIDSEQLAEENISVVFLDLEMPTADGYEVLQHLRTISGLDVTPIIACTVHLGEMKHTQDNGFDGFLGKPLDADRFPGQLSRILRGESVWESQ
ncbi:MAG: response regulator, partial [Chloroflexota bacterium]